MLVYKRVRIIFAAWVGWKFASMKAKFKDVLLTKHAVWLDEQNNFSTICSYEMSIFDRWNR